LHEGDIKYNKKQLENREKSISEREERISELKDNLRRIDCGEYDDEIIEQDKKSLVMSTDNLNNNKKKILENQQFKTAEKNILQHQYDSNRTENVSKGAIMSAYRHYCKTDETLPDYIRNNLKAMPCNKGYIHKGVYFYGYLPREPGNMTTMLEKNYNILTIHEWTKTKYNIYQKDCSKQNSKKVLVSSMNINLE
jgi:hypothetical protein